MGSPTCPGCGSEDRSVRLKVGLELQGLETVCVDVWHTNLSAPADDGMCIDGHPHRCGRCDRDIVEAATLPSLSDRVAKLEMALQEIADRGPKDDPCADEYGADGKRRDHYGSETSWCTYTSDESQEESAHASDVEAYATAKIARDALCRIK